MELVHPNVVECCDRIGHLYPHVGGTKDSPEYILYQKGRPWSQAQEDGKEVSGHVKVQLHGSSLVKAIHADDLIQIVSTSLPTTTKTYHERNSRSLLIINY